MAGEVELLCEAAGNEDYEEVEQRLDTLDQLDQDRIQKEQELDEAFMELEE